MMKKLLALVILLVPLLIADRSMSEELRIGENLHHERILLPPSAPERSRMVVRDTILFLEEGGGAGILVFHDDIRTKTETDYLELYDIDGNLLLLAWIDRFGVRQVAMDRGLFDPADPSIDGVLITVRLGTML